MACSWEPVQLGSNGPLVAPLGVASSFGVGGADIERAFERGINFFYWGSLRRPDFGHGLSRIAVRARERMVIVIQTYSRWASGIGASLERGLRALRTDYADILLLGWWNLAPPDRLLDAARALIDHGKARAVMISCHHRPTFQILQRDPRIDLMMLRYNAAHPGAEKDVFVHLPKVHKPIVSYTATSWGQLLDSALVPSGERPPTGTDCYRFVLSSPHVSACWCGPRSGQDLELAMRALDLGPMSTEELDWMRRVGDAVRTLTKSRSAGMRIVDRAVNLISGFGLGQARELR